MNDFTDPVSTVDMCYPVQVLMLDAIIHTVDSPFCFDLTCPCHALANAWQYEHVNWQVCECDACAYVRQVLAEGESL